MPFRAESPSSGVPLAFKEETPATQCLTHAKCKRCTAWAPGGDPDARAVTCRTSWGYLLCVEKGERQRSRHDALAGNLQHAANRWQAPWCTFRGITRVVTFLWTARRRLHSRAIPSDCGDRRDRRECCAHPPHRASLISWEAGATSPSADLKSAITLPAAPQMFRAASGSRARARASDSEQSGAPHHDHVGKERQRFRHLCLRHSKTPITFGHQRQEVYDLRTGNSETVNVNGNVTHYRSPTTSFMTMTTSASTRLDTKASVQSATTRLCMGKSAGTRSITSAGSRIQVRATSTKPMDSTVMGAPMSRSSGT